MPNGWPINSAGRVFTDTGNAPVYWSGGLPYTQLGALAVTTSAPQVFLNGFGFNSGKLCVAVTETNPASFDAAQGLKFDATGALLCNGSLPIAYYVNGLPMSKEGTLCGVFGDPFFSFVKFLWNTQGTNGQTPSYTPEVGPLLSGAGPDQGALSNAQSVFGGTSFACGSTTGDNVWSGGASSAFTIPADFVFEGWFYPTALASDMLLWDFRPAANGFYPAWNLLTANSYGVCYHLNSVNAYIGSVVTVNAWNYLCHVRNGAINRGFRGILGGGTAAQTGSDYNEGVANTLGAGNSSSLNIGRNAFNQSTPFKGFIGPMRLTVGTTRGLTGTSVPIPTANFPTS